MGALALVGGGLVRARLLCDKTPAARLALKVANHRGTRPLSAARLGFL